MKEFLLQRGVSQDVVQQMEDAKVGSRQCVGHTINTTRGDTRCMSSARFLRGLTPYGFGEPPLILKKNLWGVSFHIYLYKLGIISTHFVVSATQIIVSAMSIPPGFSTNRVVCMRAAVWSAWLEGHVRIIQNILFRQMKE